MPFIITAMHSSNAPLIIIGSGLAGYMLAKEWRKLDTATPLTIITADDGGFYSKPLLSTAFAQHKQPDQLMVASAEVMAQELTATILCWSKVTAIDPVAQHIIINEQTSLEFSRLVMACGAEIIHPPLTGDAVTDVQTVNTLCDYRHFRQWLSGKKHVAILGAGLVGCEFANDFINAGYAIDIIAPDPYPLAALLPEPAAKLLQDLLGKQGIQWRLGHVAKSVARRNQQVAITLSNDQELLVDGVFSAVGLRPQLSLAKSAGIQVNRGIVVNRWQQTNFPAIFALGDCAEVAGVVQMYVAPLLQSARALAKILTGGHEPVHYPAMPIVLKTPALPLVFSAVPPGIVGEWHVEGEGHHLRVLFHDQAGQLRGFVLAGDKIRDKLPLAKQLPLVFAE